MWNWTLAKSTLSPRQRRKCDPKRLEEGKRRWQSDEIYRNDLLQEEFDKENGEELRR